MIIDQLTQAQVVADVWLATVVVFAGAQMLVSSLSPCKHTAAWLGPGAAWAASAEANRHPTLFPAHVSNSGCNRTKRHGQRVLPGAAPHLFALTPNPLAVDRRLTSLRGVLRQQWGPDGLLGRASHRWLRPHHKARFVRLWQP